MVERHPIPGWEPFEYAYLRRCSMYIGLGTALVIIILLIILL